MKTPAFWYPESGRAGMAANVLTPLGWLYGATTMTRFLFNAGAEIDAKVVCVGNLTAGGTGKTPLCLALNDVLTAVGQRTAFLTRGYGGRIDDPTLVDRATHDFRKVGDEALLLAAGAPTYVSPKRVKGAQAATRDGCDVVLMDDGFQNPMLKKDLSFLVVDGPAGFGNRRMIPAGPLREPLRWGLKRADAILVLGPLRDGPERDYLDRSGKPVFHASISVAASAKVDREKPVIAFCGIGRPQKFFDTLQSQGFLISEAVPYPDHHAYGDKDLDWLKTLAEERGASLITTSKDFVRLPPFMQAVTQELPVRALFEAPEEIEGFLLQELG